MSALGSDTRKANIMPMGARITSGSASAMPPVAPEIHSASWATVTVAPKKARRLTIRRRRKVRRTKSLRYIGMVAVREGNESHPFAAMGTGSRHLVTAADSTRDRTATAARLPIQTISYHRPDERGTNGAAPWHPAPYVPYDSDGPVLLASTFPYTHANAISPLRSKQLVQLECL